MIEKAFPFRLVYKLVFARRAGGQVVRQIYAIVSALTRSVSFYGTRVDRRLAPLVYEGGVTSAHTGDGGSTNSRLQSV